MMLHGKVCFTCEKEHVKGYGKVIPRLLMTRIQLKSFKKGLTQL